MARTSIDRASVEYLKVPVTTPPDVTITNQTVELAVLPDTARPVEEDWNTGEWVDNVARILIGPGALPLEAGTYKVWVRVTDMPEIPVLTAGTITVL